MEESKEKVSMSEEKGKISVIVPVYQAEKYLAKALDLSLIHIYYTESREENVITLNTTKADSWFILRTHGEKIEDIEGGSQTKIEKDAYLIHAEDHTVKIQVDEPGLSYDSQHQ